MPGEGLQRIRERLHQNREARNASIAATVAAARGNGQTTRGTVVAGDTVFDTVTGQEGTVVHGTRENIVLPAPER